MVFDCNFFSHEFLEVVVLNCRHLLRLTIGAKKDALCDGGAFRLESNSLISLKIRAPMRASCLAALKCPIWNILVSNFMVCLFICSVYSYQPNKFQTDPINLPDYLQHSGKRLKKLKLKYSERANLRVTERECPNLEKLKLRGNGTPSVESSVVRSLSLGVVTAEGNMLRFCSS